MPDAAQPDFNSQFQHNYTRAGLGVLAAVRHLFENGVMILDQGDALYPLQEAYLEYTACERSK